MQDNEFDDLFRSKLGGLEVQPSAHVWDNIAAGLGTPKKKSILSMLSMAATTLLLLAAGTWFLLDKPVKQVQNQVARVEVKPIIKSEINKSQTAPVKQSAKVVEPVETTADVDPVVSQVAKIKRQPTVKHESTESVNVVSVPMNTEAQTQEVLAAVSTQPVAHPVVPEMQLAGSTTNNDAPVLKSINTTSPVAVTASHVEKKKKHGIHSLGDLINAVVSKVDKREDKLIEFTESDDDQSSVTGINLGIIKIKKDK